VIENPAASLYEDLARIDEALAPFSAPATDEHAGLRWMRRTLVERREHVENQIAGIERSTITITLDSAVPGVATPSAATVAALLEAVQDELRVAARSLDWPDEWPQAQRDTATTLQVGTAGHDDDQWSIELQRPAGPLDAQPTMPDGERLVFDAAVEHLLDRLEDGRHEQLVRLVLDLDLPLTLTLTPVTGDTRTVELSRQRAQALLLTT
jgi:hypothetical protein